MKTHLERFGPLTQRENNCCSEYRHIFVSRPNVGLIILRRLISMGAPQLCAFVFWRQNFTASLEKTNASLSFCLGRYVCLFLCRPHVVFPSTLYWLDNKSLISLFLVQIPAQRHVDVAVSLFNL